MNFLSQRMMKFGTNLDCVFRSNKNKERSTGKLLKVLAKCLNSNVERSRAGVVASIRITR